MKVLLINGSPHTDGCTYTALSEIAEILKIEDISSEILQLGAKPVRDCIACHKCAKVNKCVFNDDVVNEWIEKAKEADGFIIGTPVYYAHPTGQILAVLDRMFYASGKVFAYKPGASIAVARRAGTTASLDVVNKYFTINQMPMPGSSYWNMVFGKTPEDIKKDEEGLQTMRNLARNMAWLLKCIQSGKEAGIAFPVRESSFRTNFIR